MERVKQVGAFLKSVVLCGFILLFLSAAVGTDSNTYIREAAHNTTHVSLANTDLFSLTGSTERFFENIQRVLSVPSKVSFGDYLSVVHSTESSRNHLIAKRIAYTKYKVSRFDLQDIVFPFHHFW